jgi:CRISPR/Cas system-associated protein endoribonuclease Cas2
MKCTSCLGEWIPPPNRSTSKCPFCGADVLQILNQQAVNLTPDVILRNMIIAYGMEIIQNEQRLSAMISDLFAHEPKTKKLLLLSVREKVPQQMAVLHDNPERELQLCQLKTHLTSEEILDSEAIERMLNFWRTALDWEEPEETYEIVWYRGVLWV